MKMKRLPVSENYGTLHTVYKDNYEAAAHLAPQRPPQERNLWSIGQLSTKTSIGGVILVNKKDKFQNLLPTFLCHSWTPVIGSKSHCPPFSVAPVPRYSGQNLTAHLSLSLLNPGNRVKISLPIFLCRSSTPVLGSKSHCPPFSVTPEPR